MLESSITASFSTDKHGLSAPHKFRLHKFAMFKFYFTFNEVEDKGYEFCSS